MPELHEVPDGSRVRICPSERRLHPPAHRDFGEGEELEFSHIDGMYSLCHDDNGKPVHLVAWAQVEIVRKGRIKDQG